MKIWNVEITETVTYGMDIAAETMDEAIILVKEIYREGPEDFCAKYEEKKCTVVLAGEDAG